MAENEKPATETPRPADAGARAVGVPQAATEGQTQPASVSVVPALLALASRADRIAGTGKDDLARDLQAHLNVGGNPATHSDPDFRRNTAYLVQDVEKALGERLPLSKELRTEVTSLAGSLPGLTNERAQALLQSTEQIGDRKLVQNIRQFAGEVAAAPKQETTGITNAIENFENKVRLAARAEPIADTPKPDGAAAGNGAAATAAQARAEPAPTQANGSSPPNRPGQDASQPPSGWLVQQRTVADTLMDSIRAIGRPPASPSQGLDLPHTPMVDRIAAFEARILVEKEDKMLARAEKTGQAAIEAIQGISNTSAGAVLSRINEAARNNPGGMEAVLSEMRPGGQFADLRTQFNAALNTDHAAAAAYDKAASTLSRYGEQRPALEGILAKRADPALSAKLERIDAELGEGAGRVPSKQDGKSMLDDLAKTVAEIVSKAVDSVRTVFSRSAAPGASASPGPSPSP